PPTPQEIATLRTLPRGRGSNLNAAIVALVDKGVEQKAIGKALDLSPGAISSRVKLYRQKTVAVGDAETPDTLGATTPAGGLANPTRDPLLGAATRGAKASG
ncbi:hypothetical protein, partial [Streptomyces palmae]